MSVHDGFNKKQKKTKKTKTKTKKQQMGY